ncbi:hypothetical protein [Mannheimia granulomatis]|uniref:hypothetical protein n=1 Tax=Mannheimia granulomatis TaxID=85402 RepID=UPI00047C768F|nr:hypothetical protein [Mannheimia granulomatis]QLB18696.1 hypothetical protein A6B41_04150 [Mannheimia granulomatis]
MREKLFCSKTMKKQEQLDLVYSDFLDMRVGIFLLYKPNNVVLRFDKKGYFFGIYDQDTLFEKMVASFQVCRYTLGNEEMEAIKLIKKFKKSLPVLDYLSLLNATKVKKPIFHQETALAIKKIS